MTVEREPEFTGRNRGLAIGIGLGPLWVSGLMGLSGMYPTSEQMDAVAIAGVSGQVADFGAAALLTIAGAYFLYRVRSSRAALVPLLLLTFPALFLVILGPSILLILGNSAGQ